MKTRAWIVCALLVSPAWAQEPAAPASTPSPRGFDLTNDAIRKIVHDTAASQSRVVTISDEMLAEREATPTIRYVPPEAPPVVKKVAPQPASAPSPFDEFFNALVGIVVDTAIDTTFEDHSDEALREQQYKEWAACHAQDPPPTTEQPYGNCRLPPPPR